MIIMYGPMTVNKTGPEYISMETQLLHNVAATTIASLGFITNIGTILAIVKTRLYRRAAILLVLNLIVLNLIPCVFTLPYIAYLSFTYHDPRVSGSGDGDPDPLVPESGDGTVCKVMSFLTYSIVGSEILGLILICVNRYILVVHFDKYQQIYERRRNLAIMLVISWSVYPIILMFPVLEVWGQLKYDPQRFFCHPFNEDSFGNFLVLLTGSVSLPVLAFCYIALVYKVWTSRFKVDAGRSIRQSSDQSGDHSNKPGTSRHMQEIQLVITVILILTTFTLLYTPFLVMSILSQDDSRYDPKVLIVCLYTAWTHCVINPVVYSLRNSHILKVYCCRTSNI